MWSRSDRIRRCGHPVTLTANRDVQRTVAFQWLLSLTVCALALPALAQDEQTQRILPLPSSTMPDAQKQMAWLQQLKSQLEASAPNRSADEKSARTATESTDSGELPVSTTELLQQFQNLLGGVRDKLPEGFRVPDLSSVSRDQLERTMESPEVQQRVRELLERFSRDGVLPPAAQGRDGLLPPDLARDTGGVTDRAENRVAGVENENTPRKGREKRPLIGADDNAVSPEARNPLAGDSSDQGPAERSARNSAVPGPSPAVLPRESVRRLEPFLQDLTGTAQPADPLTETSEPAAAPAVRRAPLRRRDSSRQKNSAAEAERSKEPESPSGSADVLSPEFPSDPNIADPAPSGNERRSTETSSSQENDRPVLPREQIERLRQALEPLLSSPSSEDIRSRSEPATSESENPAQPDSTFRGNSSPDSSAVQQFLRQQLKQLQKEPTNPAADTLTRPGAVPDQKAADSPDPPSVKLSRPRTQTQRDIELRQEDMARELERSGLGGALKRIVENAKKEALSQTAEPANEESNVTRRADGSTASPGSTKSAAGTAPRIEPGQLRPERPDSGLATTIREMFKNLEADASRQARDAEQRESSRARSSNPRSSAGGERNSWLNQMTKTAAGMLQEVRQGPGSADRATVDRGAGFATAGPFDLTPVLILVLGLVVIGCLVWAIRRGTKSEEVDGDELTSVRSMPVHQIRNRKDVIRAFHQFASASPRRVPVWWTHRAVARSAGDEPGLADVLADFYEAARYLPDTEELPEEWLKSARIAFATALPSSARP
jgi:hypothetical protein